MSPRRLATRLHRATISPQRYALVAWAALAALTLIVFTGAAVRVTGSGLGCPDWPRCYHDGRLTPQLNTHAYIEFGNRMLTSVVSLAAVAALVLAYRRRPYRRDLMGIAWLLPLGVAGQAIMGGLTVKYGLSPSWVMAHLILSMLVLVAAGALAWRARPETDAGREPRRATPALARAVWALFALGGLTIAAGTVATAAGPHAGGEGTGDVVARLEFKGPATLRWLVERHGLLAALLGLLAVAVFVAARRTGADPHLVQRLGRVCVLLALQGALGIAQYALELPAELVWVHVALATLLWVGIVLAAVQAGAPRERAGARESRAALRAPGGERRAPV
jgi:cytochrome c oxidase assembly protein subunit 15